MAVTTPAATPKHTTLKTPPSAPPEESPLSIPDALSVLSYLSSRGLLCSTCGFGWAVVDNAAYTHCVSCKRPNMTYNPKIGKGSDFERLLCKRLGNWVAAFLKADKGFIGQGPATPDTADSSSK